jgi:hypothetical protein
VALSQHLRQRAGALYADFWRTRRAVSMPFDMLRVRRNLEVVRQWHASPSGSEDLTVVGLVRDGEFHIESFIEHHLDLGASHIVLLDNGSADGTIEVARGFDRVTVLRCSLSFARYSLAMRRYLTDQFGRGGWVLLADIDERFDYPYSEQLPLPGLLRYLNQAGFTSMFSQMLDLFPAGSMSEWPPTGREAIAASCWYDVESFRRGMLPQAARHNEFPAGEPIYLQEGILGRAFGVCQSLSKFPLMSRVAKGPRLKSAHFVSGGRVADVSGILRHYKLDSSFPAFCARAVEQGNYFKGSKKYQTYLKALEANPDPTLWSSSSRRYVTTAELVSTGIISAPEAYCDFVRLWQPSVNGSEGVQNFQG